MRGTIEVPAERFAFLAELKSMFHPTRQQLSIADSVNLYQVCLGGRLVRSGPPGDGCVEKQNVSMFLPCPRSHAPFTLRALFRRRVRPHLSLSPLRPLERALFSSFLSIAAATPKGESQCHLTPEWAREGTDVFGGGRDDGMIVGQ